MPSMVRYGILLLSLCALLTNGAQAGLVLDEPLQGSTTGTRSGGNFVTGGWMVTGYYDAIYWHVPTITNGAIEFSVQGIVPNECRTNLSDKTELFHMYDYTWNNSDTSYAPGYRDNPYKHYLRKTDCLDTARVNSMEILWLIGTNYLEGDSPVISWNSTNNYLFREEWAPDSAGNSTLKTFRDGVLILTQTVPGVYAPTGQTVRIGASTRRDPLSGAPVGAIFSNLKVWDQSTPTLVAPLLIEPATNQVVNTPLASLEWSAVAHTRYEARITQVSDPDSALVWGSGEVTSDRNFAWSGALGVGNYYAFARVGNSTAWSSWSAGRPFSVDTRVVPSGANLTRLAGNSFSDKNGAFLGLGASYFQALRRAKYDRVRLTNDLALLAAKGFNYIRVLSMVGWDGLEIAPVSFTNGAGHAVAAWPDYWQQFRDLLDIASSYGLRVELTIFADAENVMPSKTTRQSHLDGVLANIAGREGRVMHLEVANEAWQNGFPGSQGVADLREFTQYLGDRTGVPVAITSNDDTSNNGITSLYTGSAADLATVHFSRDISTSEGGWLPVRDCYRAANLPGVPPVSSNEPIGSGSSVSSENDPLKLCAAAIFAYIANLPSYVYHSRAGVYGYVNCCPPSGGEVRFEDTAGINAYQFVRQLVPPDVASWIRNDGLETSAPFTVFCNGQANTYWPSVSGATNGCDRNIGGAKGREFVCFPMGILGGGVTLLARRPVKFQVFHPLTGVALSNLTLAASSQITLAQGPGAYLLKGSFQDVNTPIVPKGAIWKYFDNGSNQNTAWRQTNFNDSAWVAGPAELGYGDGDEATIVGYGPQATNKYVTTYFRRTFVAANPGAYTNLLLRLLRDDGAIVYLNGAEVFRSNMPTGAVTYLTYASTVVGGTDETTFFTTNLSPNLLIAGTNLLAVELHQANASSSDISFDLELSGLGNLAPIAIVNAPAQNSSVDAAVVLNLGASAWDSDGAISRIEFWIDGTKVGEDASAPFSLLVSNLDVGTHMLVVVAIDDTGARANSATVTFLVKNLLVTSGSTWHYLDNGSDQGTAWQARAFNDSAWAAGPAELGYGDGDEATIVSFGSDPNNKYTTTYFRRAFSVSDPSLYTNLVLRLLRDDGAIVYLNGAEVFRSNMPTGAVNYATFASVAIAGADETTFFPKNVSPAYLLTGSNVLAVEIHQANLTSSDISFDLELNGEAPPPPPPRIDIARAQDHLLLSWPASASTYRLQWTSNLLSPSWFYSANTVSNNSGLSQVSALASNTPQFFRLAKP